MINRYGIWLIAMLVGCADQRQESEPLQADDNQPFVVKNSGLGKQFLDGVLSDDLVPVTRINSTQSGDFQGFHEQSAQVVTRSTKMANQYGQLYKQLNNWVASGASLEQLDKFGIAPAQMAGADRQGNILFTGYFSPVMEIREKPDEQFKHPLYRMPTCKGRCPTRAEIQQGKLANRGLELGYSRSLIDNFLMEVQGSGFVHYNDPQQLYYLGYSGKNGHGYVSIGKVLLDKGEITKEEVSLKTIKQWAEQRPETVVKTLLEHNASYVFFEKRPTNEVIGAAGIPLLPMVAVAADRTLLPMGTPILAEVPLLDEEGNWRGQHELRLLIALDVGGAVKKGHLDLYHGLGEQAGIAAGNYKHFGRVWKLALTQ